MSLVSTGDQQLSQSYGLYGGMCVGAGFDMYLDAEMVRGSAPRPSAAVSRRHLDDRGTDRLPEIPRLTSPGALRREPLPS